MRGISDSSSIQRRPEDFRDFSHEHFCSSWQAKNICQFLNFKSFLSKGQRNSYYYVKPALSNIQKIWKQMASVLQYTLQRHNTENLKQNPRKGIARPGHSPNFHIHVSVSNFYIPTIDLSFMLF